MILAGQVKADQQLYISDSYYNLNSSEFMELCNISNPTRDGEEVLEARDREVEEQDFAFVPAAPT